MTTNMTRRQGEKPEVRKRIWKTGSLFCCLHAGLALPRQLVNTRRGWRSDKINQGEPATPTRSAVTISLWETSKEILQIPWSQRVRSGRRARRRYLRVGSSTRLKAACLTSNEQQQQQSSQPSTVRRGLSYKNVKRDGYGSIQLRTNKLHRLLISPSSVTCYRKRKRRHLVLLLTQNPLTFTSQRTKCSTTEQSAG